MYRLDGTHVRMCHRETVRESKSQPRGLMPRYCCLPLYLRRFLSTNSTIVTRAMTLQQVEALVAGILGVILHLTVFIHGEWHLYVPEILLSHGVAFFAICSLLSSVPSSIIGSDPLGTHVLPILGAYLFGLYSSIVIYRASFHRTRKFPGPKLAGLTKLWHVWQSRNSKNFLVLQRLHERYGELVRTGMRNSKILPAHWLRDILLPTSYAH
jgi:hypothetical protein